MPAPVRCSAVVCRIQLEAALQRTRSISHIPAHLGGPRMLRRQPTRSQGSWDELSTETSQQPRVSIFLYFFFSPLSLRLKTICSTCGGPTASRRSRSAPERTQGGGTGFVFLCEALFASTITQTVTSFTKKTLASPKVWQQPSSAWAKGRRLSLPLLLHHTCPSASSSSGPAVFGPFSQAAFSTAFSTPVLLAASCKTANKALG